VCYSVCSTDDPGSVSWYSPSSRPVRRPPEMPFNNRYEDYDYACSFGDRLPAPSPVYSRHGYVRRSSPSNQCDWYARGDGDGHFEPDRFHDNALQAPDGRSPYRKYDDTVNRSRDPVGCYFDEDAQYPFGGSKSSRLPDGTSRRNGGIGFDWTSAAADRKSAYCDDSGGLIIGESGEIYAIDERPPFDYNTGTVQRRAAKPSTSPYPSEPRSVDGMERRLPVGTESVSVADSPYQKERDRAARDSPHRAAATGKNESQGRGGRAKVDDIQRLTERDRVPAVQNRKQQNHVTPRAPSPRVDESAKQVRSRGHKSTVPPTSTTSGTFVSVSGTIWFRCKFAFVQTMYS